MVQRNAGVAGVRPPLVEHRELRNPNKRTGADSVRYPGHSPVAGTLATAALSRRTSFPFRAVMQRKVFSKLEGPKVAFQLVSEPSDVHREESLNRNYADIAAHAHGFSFAPRAVMAADTAIINEFIRAMNRTGEWTEGAAEVSWDHGSGNKLEYTVNGRTYSTHDNSAQLYPLSGVQVTHGSGPVDMGRIMEARGKLTENAKITLEMILNPQHDRFGKLLKVGSMGTKLKATLVKSFTERF